MGELPDQVTLRLGDERTLRLPSSAGAGYRWSTSVDDETVAEAKAGFDKPITSPSGHAAFSAHELLTLRGLKVGTTRVHCVQRRSWERDTPPLAEHALAVAVVAANGQKRTKGE